MVVHVFAWANRKADERRRKEETTVSERNGNYLVSHALLRYFFSSLFPDFSALFFPLYSEICACISRVANTIEPTVGSSSGIFRSHGLPSAKNHGLDRSRTSARYAWLSNVLVKADRSPILAEKILLYPSYLSTRSRVVVMSPSARPPSGRMSLTPTG